MTPQDIIKHQQAIIAEARTWIGTPFHHESRVKGAGVDCAQLLYAAYTATKIIPEFPINHYVHDWHMHRSEEKYMAYVLQYAVEAPAPPIRIPQPGECVLFKFGRSFSHGAIVVKWPTIIHAFLGKVVCEENVEQATILSFIGENSTDKGKRRPMRVFTQAAWSTPK